MTNKPNQDQGAPATLTNPPWVRPVVLGLMALIWLGTLVSILTGDPWAEAIFWAVIGTLCLSAVDIGLDFSRKRDGRS